MQKYDAKLKKIGNNPKKKPCSDYHALKIKACRSVFNLNFITK